MYRICYNGFTKNRQLFYGISLFWHSFKRMAESRFSPDMIKSIIKNGIIIKEYPDDTPYPSRLILGYDGNRPIHVVAAYNQNDDMEYIITAYEPDAQLWNSDFTKRRN